MDIELCGIEVCRLREFVGGVLVFGLGFEVNYYVVIIVGFVFWIRVCYVWYVWYSFVDGCCGVCLWVSW